MTPAEHRLLRELAGGPRDAKALVPPFASEAEVLQAADRLERAGHVRLERTQSESVRLSAEGRAIAQRGLPETRARTALAAGPLALADLGARAGLSPGEAKVIVGLLKKSGAADAAKGPDGLVLTGRTAPPTDAEQAFAALASGAPASPGAGVAQLVERGLAERVAHETRRLALTSSGEQLARTMPAPAETHSVAQITPELIAQWMGMTPQQRAATTFRPFDVTVAAAAHLPAKPHPLTQILAEIRAIFWRMGFQEVAGDYVESAYWNMDALFIPQDHPARDMQDTFYLANPPSLRVEGGDLARAAAVHERGGGTGSTGWGGTFDRDVAQRALLRTHTTNTTVRYLAQNPTQVSKVFGLGRVFRKETMDATHLPEFTQIEGIVVEPGATFDTLVGLCRYFFAAMGFPEVRFRPAYFPYTEPSMEIEVFYNNRWMELGGCGIFRPEVTKPLGVTDNVVAWGFGLERLAMMRLGLKDIRDLYISDVQWLREQPLL